MWFVISCDYHSHPLRLSLSSRIIEDIMAQRKAVPAMMAYFYCDFRDEDKHNRRNLVLSIISQLCDQSKFCCEILSRVYSNHDKGARKPSDETLTKCLTEMVSHPVQGPIYIIVDALDECPNNCGMPSSQEDVLDLVEHLVSLGLPNLHICVTSRPEIDIQTTLHPLATLCVSLHDQSGQKKDIADYVRSVVYSDLEQIMRRWKMEDKELVIETLSERADGMYVNYFIAVIVVEVETGFDGCSVNWTSLGTVFHQVSGVPSTNYRNLWTRHTSAYFGKSRSRTEITRFVYCNALSLLFGHLK